MSSSTQANCLFNLPVMALEYRDIASHHSSIVANEGSKATGDSRQPEKKKGEISLTHEELADRIRHERADAAGQMEERVRRESEVKVQEEHIRISKALSAFEAERDTYYSRVEAEIVQLSLAIAAKILHREAQVDPLLLAALVRMAVESMRDGSKVTVRVSPRQASRCQEFLSAQTNGASVQVTADPGLGDQDCLLETELGVTNLGLEAQLKEVEQGFFDLLALRPVNQ